MSEDAKFYLITKTRKEESWKEEVKLGCIGTLFVPMLIFGSKSDPKYQSEGVSDLNEAEGGMEIPKLTAVPALKCRNIRCIPFRAFLTSVLNNPFPFAFS